MSRIFIINDLSPSHPWLFALLQANRNLLADCGVAMPPFQPIRELIPSHHFFWEIPDKNRPFPNYIYNKLKKMAAHLQNGGDSLLFTSSPEIEAHKFFEQLLKENHNLAKFAVHALFIIGRPACMLEQRYRQLKNKPRTREAVEIIKSYSSQLPILFSAARQAWGNDNVKILANISDNPAATANVDSASSVFDFLGCADWQPLERTPLHPLFMVSESGRRLIAANKVRLNNWPALDDNVYAGTLRSLDVKWDHEFASPKHMRTLLNRNDTPVLRDLENICGLSAGALDCPDWLDSPEIDINAPLNASRAKEFAEALPPVITRPLLQRYINDVELLNEDQKIFYEALRNSAENKHLRIGEPQLPVTLTVLTMTYNHEKYITQCMDSVLAQQTDFPTRHIVIDHCSHDATPSIVTEYANKYPTIQPVLLSRHESGENVRGLFLRCHSVYASLCDGDDYFTDPRKLQKQVDFLEKNYDCALCFHPVLVTFENGNPSTIYPTGMPRGIHKKYYLADLLNGNFIQTNSVVYRWRFRNGLPDWFRANLCPGDWYWHLLHAETGKLGFIPEVMSVYRRHEKALYGNAFINRTEHRRSNAMSELNAYKAMNDHFKGRYFQRFAGLAAMVFANLLEIYTDEEDPELFDRAAIAYPEFFDYFNNGLNLMIKEKEKNTKPMHV